MRRLFETLKKYLKKYVSTRAVFIMDVILSVVASLVALLLTCYISGNGIPSFTATLMTLCVSAASSALLIYAFKTYRIIIRHMTIRELARFVMVAFCKAFMMGFVFALLDTPSRVLYVMMMADFFFTFVIWQGKNIIFWIVISSNKSN